MVLQGVLGHLRKNNIVISVLRASDKNVSFPKHHCNYLPLVPWWYLLPPQARRWRSWPGCGSCTWRHLPGLWSSTTEGRSPSHPPSLSYWRLGGRGSGDSRHRPLKTLDKHITFKAGLTQARQCASTPNIRKCTQRVMELETCLHFGTEAMYYLRW